MDGEEIILKQKKKARIVLIFSTILFALAIVPGVIAASMSVMMFDSPGSDSQKMIIFLFTLVASFPFICTLSFSSWIFYAFKKYNLAVFISVLPVLNILFSALLILFSYIFCNGRMDCF